MQENKAVNNEKANQINTKNLKPFLSVFIILLILISSYYFLWRSITIKTKNAIDKYLKDFKYSSISISGFPFQKKVIVKNIVFSNDIFLMTKNQVEAKEIIFSSFIFSNSLDIRFKDISTVNISNSNVYSLSYNEEPMVNVAFYSDGGLKSLNYSDIGYRVVNGDNKTLYTSDKSMIKVESVKNNDTTDYIVNADLQNMQNISIIEKNDEISAKIEPEIFTMKLDGSYTITKKDAVIESSIIKINNITLSGNKNNGFSVTGQINNDLTDPYSYGDLKVTLYNYNTMIEAYKKGIMEAINIETQSNVVSAAEKDEYDRVANALFNQLIKTIKKNPETTTNNGVLIISRAKNTSDYLLNGESLFNLIQQGMNQATTK